MGAGDPTLPPGLGGPVDVTMPPPEEPSEGSSAAPIAFVLGGLGLGVGVVTGLMSLGEVSTLEKNCGPEKRCTNPADQEVADSAKLLGNISTVGFVVGGIGVATGTVLLLSYQGGKDRGPEGFSVKVRRSF